jgi:hypothetical protein
MAGPRRPQLTSLRPGPMLAPMRTARLVLAGGLAVALLGAACGPNNVTPGSDCLPDGTCGAGFACNPATWTCQQITCTPGAAVGCDGDLVKRCNSLGTAAPAEYCGLGMVCRDGACQTELQCAPGTLVCADGATLGRCGSDGQSYDVVETCDTAAEFYCSQLPGQAEPACIGPCDRARQERSNFGCEFYAVDLYNGAYSGAPTDRFAIVVSNVSAAHTAHVTVDTAGGAVLFEEDVAPLAVAKFLPERRQRTTTNLEALAFRIQSTIPVVAYQFNPLNNVGVYSNDATLLVPTSSLDTDYLLMTRGASLKDLPDYFVVVAVEDDTTVQFIPSTTSLGTQPSPGTPPAIPGIAAGSAYTIDHTLNRYDALQVLATIDNNDLTRATDLTGTAITADKPIMVFGGSAGAEVPAGTQYADHIEHVMFPVSAWGKVYAVARAPRGVEPIYVRLLAYKDGTLVTMTPGPSGNPSDEVTLAAGMWIEVVSTTDFMIEATESIMVGQYLPGQGQTGLPEDGGDPAFFLLSPVEQFRTDYVFLTPDGFLHNRLVLVAKEGATSIQVDGRPLPLDHFSTIASIPDRSYEVFRLELTPGTHLVQSADSHPVGIIVYGYDEAVSYAYTGGLSLAQINLPQ